jgi:hypothetical protein
MAHVLVAWEIKGATDERNKQLRTALKEQLKGYSWVRVLQDVHIVKIDSVEDRLLLKERLAGVARVEGNVNLILTPLMVGGTYSGWLPRQLWPKIRQRTAEDEDV